MVRQAQKIELSTELGINYIPCCMGEAEQLFCSECGTAFEYDWHVEYDNCPKCGCDVAK